MKVWLSNMIKVWLKAIVVTSGVCFIAGWMIACGKNRSCHDLEWRTREAASQVRQLVGHIEQRAIDARKNKYDFRPVDTLTSYMRDNQRLFITGVDDRFYVNPDGILWMSESNSGDVALVKQIASDTGLRPRFLYIGLTMDGKIICSTNLMNSNLVQIGIKHIAYKKQKDNQ